MSPTHKPIVWLAEPARTPPIARGARIEIGYLLRRLQAGERLELPASRPMPTIGRRVSELRVTDGAGNIEWRVIYRIDEDAVVIAAIFSKKARATPSQWIETSQARLRRYDQRITEEE